MSPSDWGDRIGRAIGFLIAGTVLWNALPRGRQLYELTVLVIALAAIVGFWFGVFWVIGQIINGVDRSIDRFADRCAGRRGEW